VTYLDRTVDGELDELLELAPAIALDGPKGVGKTATGRRRARTTWLLDEADQRARLTDQPNAFMSAPVGTVLIDEWQRSPSVWDVVRRAVDDGAAPGRFLLTGSAAPTAGIQIHSGAGRIVSLRMRPMAFHERGIGVPTVSLGALLTGNAPIAGATDATAQTYLAEVVRSGFPAINSAPPRLRTALLDGYLADVVDRDLPEQGFSVRRPETLRRWLRAYAAATASTAAYSQILDATTAGEGNQPAKTTTITYREHLARIWLLDSLPGWSPSRNPFTRLQQAPKHHLADPALAARLLGLTERSLLSPSGSGMTGPLFESLATLGVRTAAQANESRVGHLRTGDGDHEVDLVIEGPDGQIVGIEVKLSATVTDRDVRHLTWLRERVGDDVVDLVVLTTGTDAYRRRDGVAVVPLALFGP
jgi:predicted AAA+ superfamily ATPase